MSTVCLPELSLSETFEFPVVKICEKTDKCLQKLNLEHLYYQKKVVFFVCSVSCC